MGREIQVNSLEEMCDLMCDGPEKEPISKFEKWKQTDVKEVAQEICMVISDRVDCEFCPAFNRCDHDHNGILDYLTEEI